MTRRKFTTFDGGISIPNWLTELMVTKASTWCFYIPCQINTTNILASDSHLLCCMPTRTYPPHQWGAYGKDVVQTWLRENTSAHLSQVMELPNFTELMLTEFTRFRKKPELECTWFLPAISELAISLPLVSYHGEFISCLSTLVKPWNELKCYKKKRWKLRMPRVIWGS